MIRDVVKKIMPTRSEKIFKSLRKLDESMNENIMALQILRDSLRKVYGNGRDHIDIERFFDSKFNG